MNFKIVKDLDKTAKETNHQVMFLVTKNKTTIVTSNSAVPFPVRDLNRSPTVNDITNDWFCFYNKNNIGNY